MRSFPRGFSSSDRYNPNKLFTVNIICNNSCVYLFVNLFLPAPLLPAVPTFTGLPFADLLKLPFGCSVTVTAAFQRTNDFAALHPSRPQT